ncbi:MAG: RNA-binding S4 domain-containing protein [Crocinitomicaceae bacterium]|nr:RNA-binding S4 domain-containing protein [Crocinitomicaceae bacterium]
MSRNRNSNKGKSGDNKGKRQGGNKPYQKGKYRGDNNFGAKKRKGDPLPSFSDEVRLNKFISNAGICSRREADVLIKTGVVEVNGKVVLEFGYKVKPGDEVRFDGQLIKSEKKQYVLLNKPKDFTVSSDKYVGRTVLQLTQGACKERIIPVGKMDKMWTGLILLTNDSDMMKRLSHPKHAITSIYHVEVTGEFSKEQAETLMEGVETKEGGFLKAEKIELIKSDKGREIGVEIKSNKNRAVERLFEAIGCKVVKLDKVSIGSLTKKDVPRGQWRHLTAKEVDFLKMI